MTVTEFFVAFAAFSMLAFIGMLCVLLLLLMQEFKEMRLEMKYARKLLLHANADTLQKISAREKKEMSDIHAAITDRMEAVRITSKGLTNGKN